MTPEPKSDEAADILDHYGQCAAVDGCDCSKPIPPIGASAAWGAEAPALPNPAPTRGAADPTVSLGIICNRTTRKRC